jgi:iron-sulfur cluster repair protein YtfE (RIC family)
MEMPQKRHEALHPLSHDHHHGLMFCMHIRKGLENEVDPRRICAYLRHFFDEHLRNHFRDEENLVFNLLSLDNPLRKEAEMQHQQLHHFRQIIGMQDYTNKEILRKFEEALNQHIRFEERQLFPHLQQEIDEKVLVRVGHELKRNHGNFCDNWPDKFWKK